MDTASAALRARTDIDCASDFLFGIFRHGYNNDRLCSSEAEAFSEISRLKDHQILVTYNLGKGCRLFTDIRLKPNYATVGIVWLPAIERQMHQNNISYRSTVTSFTLIMQFKLAFISAALATLVVATPSTRDDELASSCTTGLLECCNNVLSASSPEATSILGLLGISGQGLTGLVGFDCSLITAGSSCSAPSQAVCCDNNFNRLVAINCVPPSA
ncbi:hypothetical protein D9757_008594 [Collybiopsis confluens]|uniref:Hydrophobin n=1 Tax=Collybiopsis confluens TaxID=2823264 RepID=A0A8H5HMV1_9AGAR|nr:hypothetical protein D9757_008594 [Collybiopsis confluens]